jgi:ribosome-binding protein aMBF1 (putative translation factor)
MGWSKPFFVYCRHAQSQRYGFSTHVGSACARQFISFQDLADKLKLDVHALMKQCNAKTPPTRALVKGLARELKIDVKFLEKLADEVRRDLGAE